MSRQTLLSLLLLGACGGAEEAPPVTITGSAVDTWFTGEGAQRLTQNLAQLAVEADVVDGDGYLTVGGAGGEDGTFVIYDVPGGDRLVQVGVDYFATGTTHLDLGRNVLGRPDVVPAPAGTGFSVDLGGLDAAQPGDLLHLYAVGTGFAWVEVLPGPTPRLTRALVGSGMLDAARGDRVKVAQTATRVSSKGVSYLAVTRGAELAPFSAKAGEVVATAPAALAPLPPSYAALDWRSSEFAALRGAVSPRATVDDRSLVLYVVADQVASPVGPYLFESVQDGQGFSDVDYGVVSFGNPSLPGRAVVGAATLYFSVKVTAPGASSPAWIWAETGLIAPLNELTSGPIRPRLSPPRRPTVAGRDAFAAQTGVGLLPRLAWSAPAMGAPTSYLVEIFQLDLSAEGETRTNLVARISTTRTHARLPAGPLAAGKTYVATIQARDEPGVEPHAPYRGNGRRLSTSKVVTDTFAP